VTPDDHRRGARGLAAGITDDKSTSYSCHRSVVRRRTATHAEPGRLGRHGGCCRWQSGVNGTGTPTKASPHVRRGDSESHGRGGTRCAPASRRDGAGSGAGRHRANVAHSHQPAALLRGVRAPEHLRDRRPYAQTACASGRSRRTARRSSRTTTGPTRIPAASIRRWSSSRTTTSTTTACTTNGVERPVKLDANGNPTTLRFGVTTDDEMCVLTGAYFSD
jgi:hypothetical protein